MPVSRYKPPERSAYEPAIGDEITFAKAEVNRNVVYTITDINYQEVTITTPTHLYSERVFTYHLSRGTFAALEPRTLEAA